MSLKRYFRKILYVTGTGMLCMAAGLFPGVCAEAAPSSEEPSAVYRLYREGETAENPGESSGGEEQVKSGLIKEDGRLYYYENGVQVKKRWVTVDQHTYYFGSSGAACTGNVRIGGTVYVFRLNGRLVQPAESAFVTVNGMRFYVNPQGQASTGSVKIGSKVYVFRASGRLVKPAKTSFVTVGGQRYYVNTKGQAYTGNVKIGEKIYVFDSDGSLVRPAKTGFVTTGGKMYYVSTGGQAYIGWLVLNGKLYYANVAGVIWTNKSYEGIVFGADGAAQDNVSARLKIKTMDILDDITTSTMTSSEKLRACWDYIVDGGRFGYWPKYPDLSKKGWQKETALDMLNTHRGNCYSFSCAFSALAAEIGYRPKVYCGRVPGTRDGAADGMTRHSWVSIDGRYYDPEGQFAGWYRGMYGTAEFNIRHTTQQVVDFRTSV